MFYWRQIGETPEAGKTIVAAFDLDFNGQKRPIAIILLNSTDLHGDVNIILNYLKQVFREIRYLFLFIFVICLVVNCGSSA